MIGPLGKNLTGKNYLWYRAGEIIILGDNMRNNNDDFFNFDEDIRKDLIEQGYKGEQLTSKFEKMKKKMSIYRKNKGVLFFYSVRGVSML